MEEIKDLYHVADEKKKHQYEYLKLRLKEHKGWLQYMRQVIEIVDAFNEVTGRKCEYHTLGSLKLIIFWLKKKYEPKHFRGVFMYKYDQFKEAHPEWVKIDTFCRQDKFENNLEDAREWWKRTHSKKVAQTSYQRSDDPVDELQRIKNE